MKIKIKKLVPEAVIPKYSKIGDAGMDLTAISKTYDNTGNICYGTGLAFEIPKGFVGMIFPRSSNSKKNLLLSNSVGILDSGYRGEVSLKFKPGNIFTGFDNMEYDIGDRICQLIILPYPSIEWEETDVLSNTDRGEGGFGHTGK